jgi:two-component system LytT family sensor kinase
MLEPPRPSGRDAYRVTLIRRGEAEKEMLLQRRHWPYWALLIVLVSLLGYLNAWESYASSYSGGKYNLDWGRALSWDMVGWNLWVALAPFALLLGRRFPIDRRNWVRGLLVYAPACVGFALAHSALLVLIHFFLIHGPEALPGFLANKQFVLLSDFLTSVIIYVLVLTFGHALDYYERYREGELKSTRLESQLAQAQLQALKMQLHPHFLFNTLHSISALQLEDVAAAQKMTARLGDFLRITLENVNTQEVTLGREVEFLKCYLDIERIRFGRRLTTSLDIPPDTLDAKVPNLVLQPIVENAIRHGIASRSAPGRIDISAGRVNGTLRVQVRDNGPGLSAAAGSVREGVGLANTRARLAQLYGDGDRLRLSNAPEGGLVVTLEIPFVTNGANGRH